MTTVYCDIETYSSADLKKLGVYKYTESPDFQILMCAWAIDDGPVRVAVGGDRVHEVMDPFLLDNTVTKVAHNAQFERVCFSRFLGLPFDEFLDPSSWRDTQALASERSYPASLDGVSRALNVALKDGAGKDLIKLFCIPNRKGERNLPEDYPDEWLDFMAYCAQDVVSLREVERKIEDWPTPQEHEAWIADQLVNDNGMQIDIELAKIAQHVSVQNRNGELEEVKRLTGIENAGSVQQVSAWLNKNGVKLPNLQAETVEDVLGQDDLDPMVRRVLEARQELALAAASKYTAALEGVSPDGRLRGGFRFFGAHTGRWTGRGFQPQNLPRLSFGSEAESEAAILDLRLGLGGDQTTLKKLVRSTIVGPFTVVDYAAIEARVVAWLAGEGWALQAFRDGRDIYVETAQRMGGLTRFQGKVAVLALGYNGGINSLRVMGAEGNDDELQRMVNQWRRANKRIVQLWADMGNTIEDGGLVGPKLHITRHGSTMKLHLPSGRAIHYRQVAWERYKGSDGKPKESWRYKDPRVPWRTGTYGGRLVENATQAVARDLLAEGMVRLHENGYRIAAHIHDEVLVEGEHSVEEIVKILCEAPDWARGLPLDGEGFICQRYRKG